jgi:hypothetical protein
VPAQGRVTPGAQFHHPTYEFAFNGGQFETHDLDKWITDGTPQGFLAYATTLTQGTYAQTVLPTINGWNTAQSILVALNPQLVGTTAWTASAQVQGGFDTNFDTPQTVAATPDGQRFARHLLSLQENIARRERDIPANLPQVITVVFKPKSGKNEKHVLQPDWPGVLAQARALLQAKLTAGVAAPADWKDVKLHYLAMWASTDPALTELRDRALLTKDNADVVKFKNNATSGNGMQRGPASATWTPAKVDGKALEFNFALGHLRFILWLEWRAMTELGAAIP